jgi:hypothetical protein
MRHFTVVYGVAVFGQVVAKAPGEVLISAELPVRIVSHVATGSVVWQGGQLCDFTERDADGR